MQRVKTVRWPRRNIGGDRAYAKLAYSVGQQFDIAAQDTAVYQNVAMTVGSSVIDSNLFGCSINGVFGSTPNLSTLAQQYLKYRIKGISLKLTYWQESGSPVCLFTNAQSSGRALQPTDLGPQPGFPAPTIATLPEQRWAKYRTCAMTAAGAKPTTLKAYYSVNKVQGPDMIVKNDNNYTGNLSAATPYWSSTGDYPDQPDFTPWLQFGLMTLSGQQATSPVIGVLKVQATVYAEFFGKRVQTQ